MHIADMMDAVLLGQMIETGYVGMQRHPTEDLMIYNYTHAAQYDRVWNDVTRKCRGLIIDGSGFVVARPFEKFFNYGEHEEGTLDLDAPVTVTDKLDGSLGILYPLTGGGYAVATRGSFTSEQAIHATAVWREKYSWQWEPIGGATALFEIIYPANRIVCDYRDTDDLFLLAIVNNNAGVEMWDLDWPGPRVEKFEFATLRDALAAEPRPNAEGLVVTFACERVKIKQDDYVALHRIVTGLSERVVWERLGNGETIRDISEHLPDEFAEWVDRVARGLSASFEALREAARAEFEQVLTSLPGVYTRAEFAEKATRSLNPSLLFLLLDRKFDRFDQAIWRSLKPSGQSTPRAFSEDVA